MTQRLLILGGTREAATLARRLAETLPELEVTTSLAGRTTEPPSLPGQMRIGGFGGVDGLKHALAAGGFSLVVDATHPFASRISAHAKAACDALGLPVVALRRPEWRRQPGDNWVEVAGMDQAAARLPQLTGRAFLAIGRQELVSFSATKGVWFLVRLLSPEPLPLTDYEMVTGRGPFRLEDEIQLLARHRIGAVVSKASGGEATYAKIAAARALGLPVVMVSRPGDPETPAVAGVEEALRWVAERRLGG